MTFHSDALSWLTSVRNRQSVGDDADFSSDPQGENYIIKPTPNRWMIKSSSAATNNNTNSSTSLNEHIEYYRGVPATSSTNVAAAAYNNNKSNDDELVETLEMMRERQRRRAVPLKTLLLRNAPPRNPSEPVPTMAFGFDAIDTKAFTSSIAQMYQKNQYNNNSRVAKQALNNVANSHPKPSSNISQNPNASSSNVVSNSTTLRLSDDGICVAQGIKTVAEIDFLVHQLKQQQQSSKTVTTVTSLDVSNSGAVQTYSDETEGPLLRKILPLVVMSDNFSWLRISVLIADKCQLHDYDADHLARCIREPGCTLEKVSIKNNIITEEGADRLKKAIKYNSRIMYVELAGNPCTQKPNEKTKQILNQLNERLAANQKKKMMNR